MSPQAICVRSVEGRKRVVNEVVATLMLGASPAPSSAGGSKESAPSASSSSPAGVPSSSVEFSAEERALALAPVEGTAAASGGAFLARPGCPHPAKVGHTLIPFPIV